MRCQECGGTGVCRSCNGTGIGGYSESPSPAPRVRDNCLACGGSGVCPTCHGMGDTGQPRFENSSLYGFR